jgi:hypothetical protein
MRIDNNEGALKFNLIILSNELFYHPLSDFDKKKLRQPKIYVSHHFYYKDKGKRAFK